MLKKIWPYLLLLSFVLSICLANYRSGTWLIGWDNLHSEFNFWLNIKRSLFAVWQEYQGLGLLGGMGHAADLPRQIFLWLVSIVIPKEFLRYFYHFLMLIAGVIGIYKLVDESILARQKSGVRVKSAVLASIFYLLNLGTIQYFFVPFEPYSTFWGLFPWEIYTLLRYLNTPSRKNLIFLFLINFFAVSQSYVQTIFLVYIICVFIFIVFYTIRERNLKSVINSFKVLLVIFVINAFWLLSSLYFMRSNFFVNRDAIQNVMATDKFFQMNKKRGTIGDFIYLKEFYYDFVNYDHVRNDFYYMMDVWRIHFSKNYVSIIGLLLFIIVCLGLLRKNRYSLELSTIFILSAIYFLSDTFPISWLNASLRGFPVFDQLFRNPFTKMIVPTIFSFSLLFGIGVSWLLYVTEKIYKYFLPTIFAVFLFFIIAWQFYPLWQGNLIYKYGRINIPNEYFDLFTFLNNHLDKGRVAIFPQSNIWGWEYYKWGLTSSGFLWYAVEQPFLDRAFDVWSSQNESYYWEMSDALYSGNNQIFSGMLEKYQIRWILIDSSIFSYTPYKALYLENLEKFINSNGKIVNKKIFGNISLYEVNIKNRPDNFVWLSNDLPLVNPTYSWNNRDQGYLDLGDYISSDHSLTNDQSPITNNYYYPFRSLFTGRRQEDLEFTVEDTPENFIFRAKIPKDLVGAKLVIPKLDDEEVTEIDENDLSKTNEKYPQIYLDGEVINYDKEKMEENQIVLSYIKEGNLEIRIPKIEGYYSQNLVPSAQSLVAKSCDQFNQGVYTHEVRYAGNSPLLRLTSVGSSNCLDFDLPKLSQRLAYLISVENRNVEGKSLLFAVINKNSQRADLETYLPAEAEALVGLHTSYFILPPMEEFGQGYSLHFDNISIGRVKTVNDLGKITVNPIPYRFLTGLKITKGQPLQGRSFDSLSEQSIKEVIHPNPSFYQIKILNQESGVPEAEQVRYGAGKNQREDFTTTLILSQSYDKGWHAYEITNDWFLDSWYMKLLIPFFQPEIKDHVLVNNWENGWRINNETMKSFDHAQDKQFNNETIVIIYLPQYLEYLGFGLLAVYVIYLLASFRRVKT